MDSVTILRSLWRNRVAVGILVVVAVIVGWMVAYRFSFPPERRAYSVGIASASIFVDTPKSQVVDVDPKGSDTLAARTNVLSNLMVDGSIKSLIAQRAGLPPEQLIASTAAAAAADPPPLDAKSHSLTTRIAVTSDNAELPIIRLQTQAPDVPQAIRLANAAVTALGGYLDSRAAEETIPDARRLRVRATGPAQGHPAMRGPGRIHAVVASLVVLLVGCAMIFITSALIRAWKVAVAFEQELVPEDFGVAEAAVDGDSGGLAFDGRQIDEPADEQSRRAAAR